MTNVWAINILSAVFIIIGGWFVITYIFPLLEDLLKSVIKDKKPVYSFMALLNILLIWMIAEGIIIYLLKIKNPYLAYLEAVLTGLDVILEFMPYLKWVILGWFILMAVKRK